MKDDSFQGFDYRCGGAAMKATKDATLTRSHSPTLELGMHIIATIMLSPVVVLVLLLCGAIWCVGAVAMVPLLCWGLLCKGVNTCRPDDGWDYTGTEDER